MGYILIVEDNPADSKVLGVLLKQLGNYTVRSVTNGQDALKQIEAEYPDLVLLDITIPDMDGIEICKKIRSNPATEDIPVIFLTAHYDYDTKARAFAAGGQDYITKPFHHGETLARVQNQLRIRRTIQQIQQYHEREALALQRLVQLKDDFIATTTHDLKNPLTLISNAIYLVRQVGPNNWDAVLKYMSTIEQATTTMKKLVTDVIDFAQWESQNPEIATVNLDESIAGVIADLRPFAQEKKIIINFEAGPADTLIKADKLHTWRILTNILANAIKYSPEEANVTIRIEPDLQHGYANVQVIDQGYGIREEEQDKIFTRFYRSEDSRHRKEMGTGLGLSIVKTLIERNSGDVWVESEVGKGSTFTVQFVIHKEPAGTVS